MIPIPKEIFAMPKETQKAFHWIIDLLRSRHIRFRMVGGFAARIYGCKRELADIDIELSDLDILTLQKEIQRYVIYGPQRYRDQEFDLLLMTLKIHGQEIDCCGIDTQLLHDKATGKWGPWTGKLGDSVRKKVFGKIIPVIPIENLIRYKKRISRAVDLEDIEAIGNN